MGKWSFLLLFLPSGLPCKTRGPQALDACLSCVGLGFTPEPAHCVFLARHSVVFSPPPPTQIYKG